MEERFVNPVRKAELSDQNNVFKNNGKEKQSEQSFPEIFKKEISGNGLSNGVKLTNAVYNLLEYFPDTDPLKIRLKDKALAIMDNLISEDIDMLLNYFKLAELRGYISQLNCLIISNEYEKLKKEIGKNGAENGVAENGVSSVFSKKTELTPFSPRQKKILDFLQNNEKAQVMDLKTVLPDVTKRTIRRDLDELLRIGKIARMGEWNQVFYKMS